MGRDYPNPLRVLVIDGDLGCLPFRNYRNAQLIILIEKAETRAICTLLNGGPRLAVSAEYAK